MFSTKKSGLSNSLSKKKDGRKSTTPKYIMGGIILMIIAVCFIQFWSLIRYTKKTVGKQRHKNINISQRSIGGIRFAKKKHNNDNISITNATPPLQYAKIARDSFEPIIDYTIWSKEETYMRECQIHYKMNNTWGKIHAPFVDKVEAKNIVERANIAELNIIPTLAILDKQNITKYTLDFMKSIKQPYIIKSSHQSGGVARVFANTYHCFKYCGNGTVMPLGPDAFKASRKQLLADISLDYSTLGGEKQYKYITPRIIIEEDIISGGLTNTDVTFWWLSNGHPCFVSEQCETPQGEQQGFQMKRIFVATDHRPLPIVFNRGVCDIPSPKPKSWSKQLDIVNQLGKLFPNEVVRIDLYGGGDDVYFSEFTFTTAGCFRRFTPILTEGLLYGLMKNKISPDVVTPNSIERMLSDKSWVALSLDKNMSIKTMHSYPSPVDVCLGFEIHNEKKKEGKEWNERLFNSCIKEARKVQQFPLRCIFSENEGRRIRSIGTASKTCEKTVELMLKKPQ